MIDANDNRFNAQSLVDHIGAEISKGWENVNKLERLVYYLSRQGGDYYDEEYEFESLNFISTIENIHIALCALLESLQLQEMLRQYKCDFRKLEGRYTKLDMLPYIGEMHSEVLGVFWTYHNTISALLGNNPQESRDKERLYQLESIFQNTPKIVKDRGVEPSNEKEVRQCVYDLLIHIFPDTVREIPVAQVTKTYKPDIGVKSLKVAAEYKFADTAEEVKKAVGGLYEDMNGYEGSEDWKYFYAVIYMTDVFYTREQIIAEFGHTKVSDNWRPILVFGKGQRKKKA